VPQQQGRRLSRRATIFAVVVLCCIAGAAASVALAVVRAHQSHPPAGVRIHTGSSLAGAQGPQLLFRNAITDKTFGKLAIASLSNPDHVRAVSDLSSDRVYYARGSGLCLTATSSFANSYEAKIFDADFHVTKTLKLPGIPSRARISRDGTLGAMTTFVNGDTYDPGHFSTRTSILNMHTGETVVDLEDFRVFRDGKLFKKQNFNFWGVTFAQDDDRIYATLGSGAESYLVQGSIKSRTFRVLTTHLECPSLSPDETHIAFKQSLDSHGSWRIYVLDLKTMKRWPLAETKSVDDQVEWLDEHRILYWRDTGIWVVNADGSGKPSVFVRQASSPAVIRSS
jgi:Tol biopolymer transport system component